jgi:hypothetical protein
MPVLGNNLVGLHAIEGRLTAPCYRNALESKVICFLQHEDDCGYNITEYLWISAQL